MKAKKKRAVKLPLWWNMRLSKQDKSRWKRAASSKKMRVSEWARMVLNEASNAR